MPKWICKKGYTDVWKYIDAEGRIVGEVNNSRYDGTDATATIYEPHGRFLGAYVGLASAQLAVEKEYKRKRGKRTKA